jgi:hypothetical protein
LPNAHAQINPADRKAVNADIIDLTLPAGVALLTVDPPEVPDTSGAGEWRPSSLPMTADRTSPRPNGAAAQHVVDATAGTSNDGEQRCANDFYHDIFAGVEISTAS